MLVRGRQFDDVALRVERYCAGQTIPRRTRWLLFSNGLSVRVGQLFSPRVLIRAIRLSIRCGWPRVIRLPDGTKRFYVKNNIRLVRAAPAGKTPRYGQTFSTKIGLPSDFRKGSVAREIAARRFLSQQNLSQLSPVMLAYDKRHREWLEEEWIDIGKSAVRPNAAEFLGHHAESFYSNFTRSRPIEEFLTRSRIPVEDIEVSLNAGGGAPVHIAGKTWPVAFTHGDLSSGNMVIDQTGRLFMVDWEDFGKRPIAADLASLYMSGDLSDRATVRELLVSLGQPDDVNPELQMRIAFAVRLALLRRKRTAAQKNVQESFGISAKAAADRIDKMESQLRALAAGRS
jgi:thiamine kinase-like enzyme